MALKQTQQILETIKRSTSPLICVPAGGGADAYASALGIASVLRKLEKKPTIVSADKVAPKSIDFLEHNETIQHGFENLRQFVIELNAEQTKVDELRYEQKDNRLFIYLSPKQGFWNEQDVRISSSGYRYDLIICVGATDLESCAHLYSEHPDFFFRTPIINIDHTPENEHFGQINVVDLTASACGEVCHDLIERIEEGLMDETIATAFLAGMVSKTRSFKTQNVTPKTLQTASKLIAKGAKRDVIVQNLYRTRSVETLRLWGRALARLKADEEANMVWTLLSQQDFLHAGAEEEHLPDVIDELIASSPHAQVVALIYEQADRNICAIVRSERPQDAHLLTTPFLPAGKKDEARLCFKGKTVVQVEKELISHIRKELAKSRI